MTTELETNGPTLASLFTGKMGRVKLTQTAIRLKRPDLLKIAPDKVLEPELAALLRNTLDSLRKG